MSNIDNIKILKRSVAPPLFEVVGDPAMEDVRLLCTSLIRYGANPMLWADRQIPMSIVSAGNGFAFIERSGSRQLINTANVLVSDKVLCLQTYSSDVPPHEIESLRICSHFLYNLEQHEFTDEQRFSMKNRILSSFERKLSNGKYDKSIHSDEYIAQMVERTEAFLNPPTLFQMDH